jgi:VanZ family protein
MRWPPRPLRLAVLLGWMALLTFWSGQSSLPIDQPPIATVLHGSQHRLAHLASFGLLALLARWAFDGWPRAAVLACVLTSAFGASDELHQTLTPGRRPAVDDWLFDTVAGGVAVVAWQALLRSPANSMIRAFSPVLVAGMFVVGTVLAVEPHLSISRPSMRALSTQAAHGALDLARSTRTFASQQVRAIRSAA